MAIPKEVYEALEKEMDNIGERLKKILNLLGLATKAGKIASGEFAAEKAVKSGKAHLVIVSEEASDNTRKMFQNMCTYYKVPIYFFGKERRTGARNGKRDAGISGLTGCRFFQGTRETDGAERR